MMLCNVTGAELVEAFVEESFVVTSLEKDVKSAEGIVGSISKMCNYISIQEYGINERLQYSRSTCGHI